MGSLLGSNVHRYLLRVRHMRMSSKAPKVDESWRGLITAPFTAGRLDGSKISMTKEVRERLWPPAPARAVYF